jgi:NAD(P)-dependent dehydrogenase (short-subunit alcohol dehydrogenase family)
MPSVFITGANRGLGLEFARQYAEAGWEVVAACRRPAEAKALKPLAVDVVGLDVADLEAVALLAERLRGRTFDVLLNNAGVYGERQAFGAIDAADWMRVVQTNVIAPLKLAEAFLPHVMGGQRKIMAFVTSLMGSVEDNRSGGYYSYRSSKAALNIAVKSLSLDLAGRGVTTVLLHPGWVRTDMGGLNAPLSPEASVSGMRKVIESAKPGQPCVMVDYAGKTLPW